MPFPSQISTSRANSSVKCPGVAQRMGGGMVTPGIDRYIMTSENVKQDQTTKDSGAAFLTMSLGGCCLESTTGL